MGMIMADQPLSTFALRTDRREQCRRIDLEAVMRGLRDIAGLYRPGNARFVAEQQTACLDFGRFRTMRENLALYGP